LCDLGLAKSDMIYSIAIMKTTSKPDPMEREIARIRKQLLALARVRQKRD